MSYNGKATPFIHTFPVIAALCLVLSGCDNSGSGKDSTAAGQTAATPETPAAASETAAVAAPAMETETPVANEEDQMTEENTQPVVAAETADTGTEQQAAESAAQEREPMSGRDVYSNFCVICHRAGMNGAPKYGDKRAWSQRITKGKEMLYEHSISGIRAMPAKGGIAWLTDKEVKDAVDYMINGSGGWGSAD